MSEFDLIKRYFKRNTHHTDLGMGDDAALLCPAAGHQLAISSDMLVSGTHFFADTDPRQLGHKTLAVNLSDLAAMGAQPRWATLALSLPHADPVWLSEFSQGFFALAEAHQVDLIGGDTTRGPLNLCVTILGEVPKGSALRRDQAQVGDTIWVSGQLGTAALALAHLQQKIALSEDAFASCAPALHRPQPRVALGLALRGIAHSAIDLSDGLLADLGHILNASHVGAVLHYSQLPSSPILAKLSDKALQQQCLLAGGDDYELCFTAPAQHRAHIEQLTQQLALQLTPIGEITATVGCVVLDAEQQALSISHRGYDHFR